MKKIATILLVMTILFASCSKADTEGEGTKDVGNDRSKEIVTGGVYDITYTEAGIYGYVNLPSEMFSAVNFGILFSTSSNPTTSNGTVFYAYGVNSENRFDVDVFGMEQGTTYYYCAFIKYLTGNYLFGKVRKFTTKSLNVSINAESSNIKHESATISGEFTYGPEISLPEYGDIYYSDEATTSNALKKYGRQAMFDINPSGSFSANLDFLDPQTTYYYIVNAHIEGVDVTSEIKQFTTEAIPEIVDLGLSVKWRNWNLGATKPEEYGGYYQWAGTQDVRSTQIDLDYDNCPYHIFYNKDTGWLKYIPWDKQSYWSGSGYPDDLTVLDLDDDPAHVELGGKWRMPTEDEWMELQYNCSATWTKLNGVMGCKVSSLIPGYTDNYIFLPAAGSRIQCDLKDVGGSGIYWSSSLNPDIPSGACYFFISKLWFNSSRSYPRYVGLSIRPVTE